MFRYFCLILMLTSLLFAFVTFAGGPEGLNSKKRPRTEVGEVDLSIKRTCDHEIPEGDLIEESQAQSGSELRGADLFKFHVDQFLKLHGGVKTYCSVIGVDFNADRFNQFMRQRLKTNEDNKNSLANLLGLSRDLFDQIYQKEAVISFDIAFNLATFFGGEANLFVTEGETQVQVESAKKPDDGVQLFSLSSEKTLFSWGDGEMLDSGGLGMSLELCVPFELEGDGFDF